MSFTNAHSLTDRLDAAAKARSEMLARFRARPSADDPAVLARQADRRALSEAREIRVAERAAARQAEAARAEAERLAAAERARAEAIEQAETRQAELKAQRDARYLARKAKVLKRR